MEKDYTTGYLLCCCITGLPFAFGFWFAWILKTRLIQYGWPGAILPPILRERWMR